MAQLDTAFQDVADEALYLLKDWKSSGASMRRDALTDFIHITVQSIRFIIMSSYQDSPVGNGKEVIRFSPSKNNGLFPLFVIFVYALTK